MGIEFNKTMLADYRKEAMKSKQKNLQEFGLLKNPGF